MHDPMTVAFEIKRPWRDKPEPRTNGIWPKGYRPTLVTIWHVDPETDGSDDSCGWFKRARHGDQEVRAKIRKAFASEWDGEYIGWFDATTGQPVLSLQATTLGLFRRAAYIFCGNDWNKTKRLLSRHLLDILMFAENRHDSLSDALTMRHGVVPKADRAENMADIIYGCLLRWTLPWYRHARWHVWHWKIQVHPVQALKRWLFSRCATCGKGFRWGYAPTSSSWGGSGPRWFRGEPGVHHHDCSRGTKPVSLGQEANG